MFKRRRNRTIVTARLNDAEYEALKRIVIERFNKYGGSIADMKGELRALDNARETSVA